MNAKMKRGSLRRNVTKSPSPTDVTSSEIRAGVNLMMILVRFQDLALSTFCLILGDGRPSRRPRIVHTWIGHRKIANVPFRLLYET